MKNIFLLLLLMSNLCFGQVDLNLGLRAYYPFSGNANDVSGNNNNPVFNNATLTADRLGNPNSAYHFNGTNTYMRIPNSPTINMGNTMSIALWVKPMGFYTGTCHNNMLIMKGDADYLTGNYYTRFTPDPLPGCVSNPDLTKETFWGPDAFSPDPFIQLNKWYSVIWTTDGVNGRIYIDCVLKGTYPATVSTFTNSFDLFLGRLNNATFPYWLNGDLDEVRIYNRALNQDEVNTLGGCITATPCNNWLFTPNNPSYATVGDLDVTGNKLTVEVTYNRTVPFNSGLYPGHLVSKHTDVSNVNYSLFPNGCAITTTNGYKSTFETCGLALNKTYHVAMVYDGSFLKFYRNGFLLSQVACTGNMVQNDLLTTIAQYTGAGFDQQFMGYVNEVRIWNVARTQAQLQTYMNSSLPNPTTIPGLLGYYTFDNLLNKQGNAAFNATLVGSASINATNSSCTFIADSCVVPVACNNWLSTPSNPSYATTGDLDVSGTQLTVEANMNRVPPLNSGQFYGHVVSKHTGQANVNYALSLTGCEITTTSGYITTTPICDPLLNKTYHIAMVYNGSTLKFYRNGFLMSSVPCTGNMVTNNLLTTIGEIAGNGYPFNNQVLGFINEVRVWNVARTQAQIQTYMNSSLPNPTTQTGLLGYYTFDNLLNKQGNAAYNVTLNGAATINATNPNCTFVADSCPVTATTIINAYTPVQAINLCTNFLQVEDGTPFNTGDTVLIIQMKGAVIDSSNAAAFGTITDYKNSGNYEFNYVKSRSGNNIELKNSLTRQYDIPAGKVQLIRVPYYNSLSTTSILTCLPWDGSKGGVLAFNVQNTLTLNENIDVSGKGFKGAPGYNPGNATLNCNQNNYNYPTNTLFAAQKGESITTISNNIICGKGSPAAGGGGGLGHNSGGGGGGNGGIGGFGGYQLEPCGSAPFDNRGIGGKQLTYSTVNNRVFMGSGGGAGHADNPGNIAPGGGNGAAIIIISADKIQSNTKKIIANGDNGVQCSIPSSNDCHDAGGGGGAGGTVLLSVNQFLDNSIVETKGGKGADVIGGPISLAGRIGPGGGGAGGLTFLKPAALPANLLVTNTGGANGVLTQDANNPWGATPGAAGQNLFNLVLPISVTAFQKNIDSVRIKDSILICNSYDFKGLAYIHTNAINTWQWYFGDGGTANTQNTTHIYTTNGSYTVKLVVTDINGCKDSISKNILIAPFVADAGNNAAICQVSLPAIVQLNASAGATYAWTPAALLNNPSIQNPVATISSTTRFYVTITNTEGCSSTDSVLITLATAPANTRYPTLSAFPYQNLQLQARNIGGTGFQWLPDIGLNNNTIANPVFYYSQGQEYNVRINTGSGCIVVDTQLVVIKGKKGIYVPRGFTPNGDGNNDRLYPILIGIKQLNYFKIYNRWGNLLFETTSGRPEDGWDGTFKGKKQPVEAYTWVVEGIDIDNITIRKNGNTLLIR